MINPYQLKLIDLKHYVHYRSEVICLKPKEKQGQIVIQKRIEELLSKEFNDLLKNNKKDRLLKLLIEDRLDDMDLDDLKKHLEEGD